MRKFICTLSAAAAAFSLSACGTAASSLPITTASSASAASAPAAPAPAPPAAAPAAPSATSCDAAREEFLTGTPSSISAALTTLKADKTANAIAREYADYWLNRDAADASLRDMDKGLINMSCTS